jgi:hypothetical protein
MFAGRCLSRSSVLSLEQAVDGDPDAIAERQSEYHNRRLTQARASARR